MKSHLPSLYQSKKTDEISNPSFSDITHKMDLINKARITVTTIELNEIIKELYEMYQNDDKIFSSLDQTLQIKRNQLFSDKERFNSLQTKYNTLKSNSSFLKILEKQNLKYRIEELIKSINDVDNSRKSHHPPPMSADPQSIINKKETNIHKYLHLKELNYREFESLIYLLKKKALSVDKSDECIGPIIEEFNSVSNLIECYKKLENENKQLKNFEKVHIKNPMTKRQLFAKLSSYGNQSMVLVLQSYIQSIYQFSKNLHQPLPMKNFQSFETVCNDQEFNQKEISFKAESPDHNQVSLNEAFSLFQEQYDKMSSSEIFRCNLIPKNFFDESSSRLDNLIKSNAELCNKMRSIHIRYEKAINDISVATKQIMNNITEKRKFECFTSKTGFNFIDLNNNHIDLIKKQYNNRNNLKTLEMLISSFGLSLISDKNQILNELFLSNIEKQNYSPSDLKNKKQSLSKSNTIDQQLLCQKSPTILISALEIALQIANLNESVQKVGNLAVLKNTITNLKGGFSDSLNDMNEFLKNKIEILQKANEINLRKPLENKEINANLNMRTDQYTQTEEVSNKKK